MTTITINIVDETAGGLVTLGPLQIESDRTVAALKRSIRALYSISPSDQRLYFNGTMLQDAALVGFIGNNGTVRLRRSNVIEIRFTNSAAGIVAPQNRFVNLTDTIAQVKQRLIVGDNPAAYTVTFQQSPADASQLLNDAATVQASGIREFGILHLARNVPGG